MVQRFADVLERQRRSGWIEFDGRRVRLTGDGLLMADRVGVDYLDTAPVRRGEA
jgi:hypothetical protein